MDRRRLVKLLDVAAIVAVLAIVTGWLMKTPVHANGWARGDLNDYTLNLRHSREVADAHAYPFGFTYPPPSVLLRLGLDSLGFEIGGGLWIAATGLSLVVALGLTLRMLGAFKRPGWGMLGLAALVLVKYPFEFETKYMNCNAMFLALVLASLALLEVRPSLAGWFLSLSIAFKLYSVVFLPWLFVTGRKRALLAAVSGSIAWFVALPMLAWAPTAAWEITTSWVQRVAETGTREFPVLFAPYAYLVSLHATALTTWQHVDPANALDAAFTTTRCLQAAWIAVVVGVLLRSRGRTDRWATLRDASLLLLLPMPLSGQLQPHHAVVLLPAAALLLQSVVETAQGRARLALSVAMVAASFLVMEYGPARPWRGAAMNAVFVLYLAGLASVKRPIKSVAAGALSGRFDAGELLGNTRIILEEGDDIGVIGELLLQRGRVIEVGAPDYGG